MPEASLPEFRGLFLHLLLHDSRLRLLSDRLTDRRLRFGLHRRAGSRYRILTIPVEHDRLGLLVFLAWQQHSLRDNFAVRGRAIQEDGDNEYRENDKHHGTDNSFFQGSFHHFWGREYSLS